jgi:hypothetical protein
VLDGFVLEADELRRLAGSEPARAGALVAQALERLARAGWRTRTARGRARRRERLVRIDPLAEAGYAG